MEKDLPAEVETVDASTQQVEEPAAALETVARLAREAEADPDNPERWLDLGSAYAGMGMMDDTFQSFTKAAEIAPDYLEAQNALAMFHALMQDHEAALRHAEKALTLTPDDYHAMRNVAHLCILTGRVPRGLEMFDRAIAAAPEDAGLRNVYADALARVGRTKDAVEQYREALQIEPRRAAAHLGLGKALVREGAPEALESLLTAVQIEPTNPNVVFPVASILHIVDRDDLANRVYAEAAARCPDTADDLTTMALSLEEAGRFAEALDCCRRAVLVAGDEARVWVRMGSVQLLAGDHQAAQAALLTAAGLDPNHAETYDLLAFTYLPTGELHKAWDNCRRALELDPGNVQFMAHGANILSSLGQLPDSRRLYRMVLKMAPEEDVYRLQYARVLLASGQRGAAITELKRLLKSQDPQVGAQARELIARAR